MMIPVYMYINGKRNFIAYTDGRPNKGDILFGSTGELVDVIISEANFCIARCIEERVMKKCAVVHIEIEAVDHLAKNPDILQKQINEIVKDIDHYLINRSARNNLVEGHIREVSDES